MSVLVEVKIAPSWCVTNESVKVPPMPSPSRRRPQGMDVVSETGCEQTMSSVARFALEYSYPRRGRKCGSLSPSPSSSHWQAGFGTGSVQYWTCGKDAAKPSEWIQVVDILTEVTIWLPRSGLPPVGSEVLKRSWGSTVTPNWGSCSVDWSNLRKVTRTHCV